MSESPLKLRVAESPAWRNINKMVCDSLGLCEA